MGYKPQPAYLVPAAGENRQSMNCYSGSLCFLLECAGSCMSEAVTFGMSGGYHFEITIGSGVSFRGVKTLHCITDYLSLAGARLKENSFVSLETLQTLQQNEFKAGMPLMIDYDGFYIPFTQIYHKQHEKRICLIVGRDPASFFISDFVYGVSCCAIESRLFLEAVMFSESTGIGGRCYLLDLDPAFAKDGQPSRAVEILQSTLAHFFEDSKPADRVNGFLLTGISGIQEWATYAMRLFKETSADPRYNWMKIAEDLKQFTVTTRFMGQFVDYISQMFPGLSDWCEVISKRFALASDQWNISTNILLRAGMTGRFSAHGEFDSAVSSCARQLQEAFEIILQERHAL